MGFQRVDLAAYPTVTQYERQEEYIWQLEKQRLNDVYQQVLRKRGTVEYQDISDVIDLYPHLSLDEEYRLIMYIAAEYHGVFKVIAAVKKGCSVEPTEKKCISSRSVFSLPDTAAPPMEAVYHDGTAEGYWEAVLLTAFLHSLEPVPNVGSKMFICAPPADLQENWDVLVDMTEWHPTLCNNKITVCVRSSEKTFSHPDTPDGIYLTQYSFHSDLLLYHIFYAKNIGGDHKYKTYIPSRERYKNGRYSCVTSISSILIAEEKV